MELLGSLPMAGSSLNSVLECNQFMQDQFLWRKDTWGFGFFCSHIPYSFFPWYISWWIISLIRSLFQTLMTKAVWDSSMKGHKVSAVYTNHVLSSYVWTSRINLHVTNIILLMMSIGSIHGENKRTWNYCTSVCRFITVNTIIFSSDIHSPVFYVIDSNSPLLSLL